nr:MAG TPA: hypothetical protein [Inoviridae sp.]
MIKLGKVKSVFDLFVNFNRNIFVCVPCFQCV